MPTPGVIVLDRDGRRLIRGARQVVVGPDGQCPDCCSPTERCLLVVRALPCYPIQQGCKTSLGPVWVCADMLCGDGSVIADSKVFYAGGGVCYATDPNSQRPMSQIPVGENFIPYDQDSRFDCRALGCQDPQCAEPDQCVCLCYSTLPNGTMACCMGQTDATGNPLWDFTYWQRFTLTRTLTPYNGGDPSIPGCTGTGSACLLLDRITETLPGAQYRTTNTGPCCVSRKVQIRTVSGVQNPGGVIGCGGVPQAPFTDGPLDGPTLCPPVPGQNSSSETTEERETFGPCRGYLTRRSWVYANTCSRYWAVDEVEEGSYSTNNVVIDGVLTTVCVCEGVTVQRTETRIDYTPAPSPPGACEACAGQLSTVPAPIAFAGGEPIGGALGGGPGPITIGGGGPMMSRDPRESMSSENVWGRNGCCG